MKKLVCLFFIFITVISNAGCSKKSSDVTAVTAGLSFTAEISFGDVEIECLAETDKNGNAEFTILAPEEIKELRFSFRGDDIYSTYKGLEHKFSTELPQTNAISSLYKILRNAAENKASVIKKDDNYILKGSADDCNYTMYLGATGLPIKISCDNGLCVIIKNATITQY